MFLVTLDTSAGREGVDLFLVTLWLFENLEMAVWVAFLTAIDVVPQEESILKEAQKCFEDSGLKVPAAALGVKDAELLDSNSELSVYTVGAVVSAHCRNPIALHELGRCRYAGGA